MIIQLEDLNKANDLFHYGSESILEPFAIEMNSKHSIISILLKDLENKGVNTIIIDEIMISILSVWYVIEKRRYKRIKSITEEDVIQNLKLFSSFISYFNASESEEKELLNYLRYEKDLLEYAVHELKKIINEFGIISEEVLYIYFSIIKCFEDKLAYQREEI